MNATKTSTVARINKRSVANGVTFGGLADAGYDPIPCYANDKRPIGDQWQLRTHTPAQFAAYEAAGHSIGLRCVNLLAADIDILDAKLAAKVDKIVRKALSLPECTPVRIGQAPKRLLVFRCDDSARSWDIADRIPKKDGGAGTLFQLLGPGRQFITRGIHPGTGEPYRWVKPLPNSIMDLPVVTDMQLEQMRTDVGLALIEAGYRITGSTGGTSSTGDTHVESNGKFSGVRWRSETEIDKVLGALCAIPPDCDRKAWFRVACALHDGTHGDADGFDLFHAWSSGELHGAAPANYKGEADCWTNWRGIKAGKGISTGTLFGIASEYAGAAPASVVTTHRLGTDVQPLPAGEIFGYGSSLDEVMVGTHRAMEPILPDLLYAGGMTMFYGKQKEGKSFALMQIATACAAGEPLWAQADDSPAKGEPFKGFLPVGAVNVVMLCAEDHGARIQNRFRDLMERGVLPKRKAMLHLLLRSDLTNTERGGLFDQYAGREGVEVLELLIRSWAKGGVEVLIFDTVTTIERMLDVTHGGKDAKARDYAQGAFYDTLADELGIAIIGTGHLRKGRGKNDENLDPMDLVNTTGAVNAGISHFWAFTKLPSHMEVRGAGERGKERRFYATGREIEHEASLHLRQGVEGMGGLWVSYGKVSDVELGARSQEYLTTLELLLADSKSRPVSSKEIAAAVSDEFGKTTTVGVNAMLKRFAAQGLTWKGKRLVGQRGKGGGWKLVG